MNTNAHKVPCTALLSIEQLGIKAIIILTMGQKDFRWYMKSIPLETKIESKISFQFHCVKYARIRVFPGARIFPYNDRIYDSVLIQENNGGENSCFKEKNFLCFNAML